MDDDRRKHPRFNPTGLRADIIIDKPDKQQILSAGEVIDISYSGIKIKLGSALTAGIQDFITIKLKLPESGIPVTITGTVVHYHSGCELGMHYAGNHAEELMDEFMFECVKTTH